MSTTDWGLAALVVVIVLTVIAYAVWLYRRPAPYGGGPVAYGLDFSWGRPPIDAILAGGWTFVVRYLCCQGSGKLLTPDEAQSYLDAGLGVVSNWERDAGAWREGYDRGYADAAEALWWHDECGGGPDDPIYFSIDQDVVTEAEYQQVVSYMRGCAEVMGWDTPDPYARVGAYAEYHVIRRLFDDGLIRWGWQTYAWSGGAWDPRAQLRQVLNGQTVGGAEVDYNEAWAANYGAWGQTSAPVRKGDGDVLLRCPFDDTRLDLLYVGDDGVVMHRWDNDGMAGLWAGGGPSESLGGQIVQGTLSAQWNTAGDAIDIVGLGAPDEPGMPANVGNLWGTTIHTSGAKTGWGSLTGVWGVYPGPTSTIVTTGHRRVTDPYLVVLASLAIAIATSGMVACALIIGRL